MHDHNRAAWIAEALARYEAPLLRFATKLMRDGDRARDLVQETFLRLCEQDRASVEGHLAAWLFRVCRNRALDLRRKDTRMEAIDRIEQAPDAVDPRPDPAETVARREDTGVVMKIFETLPEHQQEAVYLRFQGGLSYKEISEITGHSVTNVGFMLHAAVKAIRAHLAEVAPPVARTAEGTR
ncbi:MAG: sigma-70 family RNA polymerase sigma factor [Kofleriaceae bacterium]